MRKAVAMTFNLYDACSADRDWQPHPADWRHRHRPSGSHFGRKARASGNQFVEALHRLGTQDLARYSTARPSPKRPSLSITVLLPLLLLVSTRPGPARAYVEGTFGFDGINAAKALRNDLYIAGYTAQQYGTDSWMGGRDIIVGRYDVSEVPVYNNKWKRQLGTSQDESARGLEIGSAGIVVCGEWRGSGSDDIWFAVLNKDTGSTMLTQTEGSTADERCLDVTVGVKGGQESIYLVGYTTDQTLGTAPEDASGGSGGSGVPGTAPPYIGGGGSDGGSGDPYGGSGDPYGGSGDPYGGGSDPTTSSGGSGSSTGGEDFFVARYDVSSSGTSATKISFVRTGTVKNDRFSAVSYFNERIYACGRTAGSLWKDNANPTSFGTDDDYDMIAAAFNRDLQLVWKFQGGSSMMDEAVGISSLEPTTGYYYSSEVLVAGTTRGSLPSQSSNGGEDYFYIKLMATGDGSASGNFVQLGTSSDDRLVSLAVETATQSQLSTTNRQIVMAGYTKGSLFGISNNGLEDMFVQTIPSSLNPADTSLYNSDFNVQIGTATADIAQAAAVVRLSQSEHNGYVVGLYTWNSFRTDLAIYEMKCPPHHLNNATTASCQRCPQHHYGAFETVERQKATCTACPLGSAHGVIGVSVQEYVESILDEGYPRDTTCHRCYPGWHTTGGAGTACVPCPEGHRKAWYYEGCTACDPGTYAPLNSTSCIQCPKGSYQPNSASGSCVACGPGKYSTDVGASANTCKVCPTGTYQDSEIASTCKLCPPGTYNPSSGATLPSHCLPCPVGRYNDLAGSTTCKACGRGYFNSAVNASSFDACQKCLPGTYAPNEDTSVCAPCPTGSIAPGIGQGNCEVCPAGTIANTTGSTSCTPCPRGYEAKTAGLGSCSICEWGTYAPDLGTVTCNSCPFHEYQGEKGSTRCIPCPGGGKTEVRGALSRRMCKCLPGTFGSPLEGTPCKPCPKQASCKGGSFNVPDADKGFFISENDPNAVYACSPDSACPGGVSSCSDGYSGEGCRYCDDGYYRAGGRCYKCSSQLNLPVWLVICGLILFVLVLPCIAIALLMCSGVVYDMFLNYDTVTGIVADTDQGVVTMFHWCREIAAAFGRALPFIALVLRKVIKFCQLMAVVFAADVGFPSTVEFMLSIMSILNIDVDILLQAECQGAEVMTYSTRYLSRLILPLIIAGAGAVFTCACQLSRILVISRLCKVPYKGRLAKESRVAMDGGIRGLFQLLLVAYVFLHTTALTHFGCVELHDDHFYLVASPDIECSASDETYMALLPFATIGVIIYSIGIPCFLAIILLWQRPYISQVPDHPSSVRYGFLWSSYETRWYWWEGLVVMFKFCFGLSIIFSSIGSQEQVVYLLLVSICFLLLLVRIGPFKDDLEDVAEFNLMLAVQYAVLASLVFSAKDGTSDLLQRFFEVTLVLLVCYVWLFFLYLTVRPFIDLILSRCSKCIRKDPNDPAEDESKHNYSEEVISQVNEAATSTLSSLNEIKYCLEAVGLQEISNSVETSGQSKRASDPSDEDNSELRSLWKKGTDGLGNAALLWNSLSGHLYGESAGPDSDNESDGTSEATANPLKKMGLWLKGLVRQDSRRSDREEDPPEFPQKDILSELPPPPLRRETTSGSINSTSSFLEGLKGLRRLGLRRSISAGEGDREMPQSMHPVEVKRMDSDVGVVDVEASPLMTTRGKHGAKSGKPKG